MSKVEERSKEIIQAALDYANNLDDVKPTDDFSRNLCIALGQAFMKGAEWADEHQAEKDLELGWEDIPEIFRISEQLKTSWWFRDNEQTKQIGTQVFWEEVLKRFKERKEHAKVNV
jgi:hypothetical protein